MFSELDVQRIGKSALDLTNIILKNSNQDVRVKQLTREELDWCVHLSRQMPQEKRLPWDHVGNVIDNSKYFSFVFKIVEHAERPAGASICLFCPMSEGKAAELNLEILQNFEIQPSTLDGNTLRFTLYAAIFFMAEAKCAGIRIISPINEKVADYYINEHEFIDITSGMKTILYRSAGSLYRWLETELAYNETQVEGEHSLSNTRPDNVEE